MVVAHSGIHHSQQQSATRLAHAATPMTTEQLNRKPSRGSAVGTGRKAPQERTADGAGGSEPGRIRLMSRPDEGQARPGRTDDLERAIPDIDGQPAIADTIYAATEEIEHAAPELRARADSIADVIGPLVHVADPDTLLIGDPDPAALLPDDQA